MLLPSRGQSTLCAWHEFGLTNKSAEWNVVLEGFKQPWTSNTVYACWIAEWSNIQSNFLQQKLVMWSPWRLCIKGNLPGFMEIWFLWCFVSPHRDERAFCEVGPLRTIVRMERTDRPSTSFWGRNNSDRKSPKTASNRPQTTHKRQWQPHLEVG